MSSCLESSRTFKEQLRANVNSLLPRAVGVGARAQSLASSRSEGRWSWFQDFPAQPMRAGGFWHAPGVFAPIDVRRRLENKSAKGGVNIIASTFGQCVETTGDKSRIEAMHKLTRLHQAHQMPNVAKLDSWIDCAGGSANFRPGHRLAQSLGYGSALSAALQPRCVVPWE